MAKRKKKPVIDDTAQRNYRAYKRAYDAGHEDFVRKARETTAYYLGDQWDPEVRAQLEAEKRPVLTVNLILSTLNAAVSEYLANPLTVDFRPQRFATSDQAAILNRLAMLVLGGGGYEDREVDCLLDGFITGRGYIDMRISADENILGEITFEAVDPEEIILDPDASEYDPTTWPSVTRAHYLTPNDIRARYGDDAWKKIEGRIHSCADETELADSIRYKRNRFGDDTDPWANGADPADPDNVRDVLVISRQYKVAERGFYYVDGETGDMSPVDPYTSREEAEAFAAQLGMFLHEGMVTRIKWDVSSCGEVLFSDYSPYRTFTIIPYFPYFRRGKTTGLAEQLISVQDYINKLSSQELYIVNSTANSGWTVEEGSLVNMTEQELEERGAENGLVLVHARNTRAPEKIRGNPIPPGIEVMAQKAQMFLREISGMEGVLGIGSPEISGVALDRKSERASLQLQVPYTNLMRTRRIMARKLLELIQDFYTEQRIFTVTADLDTEDPHEAEVLIINQQTASGEIANDVTLGKYSVAVSVQPRRDTFDDMQFAQAMELRAAGVAIPDWAVVRYSRLADRTKIARELRELMGRAEPTEHELQLMQIQQQLDLQRQSEELAKLEAEKAELLSRAMLNQAKAEQQAGGLQSPEHIRKLLELDAQIAKHREQMELRKQLALLSAQTRKESDALRAQVSLAQTAEQTAAQARTAMINKLTPGGNYGP